MNHNDLVSIIEAILFVAGEPVMLQDIQKNLDVTQLEVVQAVDLLESQYNEKQRGIFLKRFGSHIQLATKVEYAPYVERMLQPVQKQSLSHAAMETLAVVAYRQPVTRLDVELVRGVKCDYSIQSLVNKNLIAEVGRKDTVGRPILYATTDYFLSHFGLSSINDLPEPMVHQADSSEDSEGKEEDDLVPPTNLPEDIEESRQLPT